ncbi:hypothetical protein GCS56_001276 [Vibrio metschnikovii]|uniref:hypothetical protein n=1 Tax=Vibrio metschnikovii TaxID=28172 RepID=UPI002879C2C3|nr:hypothetical protein [Vibrio metschnikovii]EKO3568502.1 hypothetical protein [Vibrio metschnikovii]EKO3584318.1 hypothetical protein [Vibrio metschnikovii]EKO3602962.1 hypothetical protein [Vibrio metschnikovii]EKO3613892.1 hypothetical protein [Vibrio metschnikovii]
MKKYGLMILTFLLSACAASPQVNWQASNAALFSQTAIQLKSSLWTDRMPKIALTEEATELDFTDNLNGTLVLETSGQLPADLTLFQLVFRQGDEIWSLEGSELELRTPSENNWEVVFNSTLSVDINRPVSVALGIRDSLGETWLVEHQVSIDKVY